MLELLYGRMFKTCALIKLPSILLLGAIYVAYVMAGGAIFWVLEGNTVQQKMDRLQEEKNEVLRKFACIDQASLDGLAKVILQATKSGISLKGNHTVDGFWKYTSSAAFAATVVTTIGYGNMSPSTVSGQIFCVFFALFGIPLNVVVLNRIGKYMIAIEEHLCDFIGSKINYRRTTQWTMRTISVVSGMVTFFVVPMMLFHQYEGWSYLEGMYYCFITLSTIGFGDYVAVSNPDRFYPDWYAKILAAWIFFGLAWLALLINHGINGLEHFSIFIKQRRAHFLEKKLAGQAGEEPKEKTTDVTDSTSPEKTEQAGEVSKEAGEAVKD
nr:PREDICTED: potassium channel subfamily K member 17-like [Lepisosteus oculatus]